MGFRRRWTAFRTGYEQFVEKRGFSIIICACAAIIAASAMFSGRTTLTATVPTPPPGDARAASQLLAESLADAVRPSPVPTAAPLRRAPPLDEVIMLRAFDGEKLTRNALTGIWSVHDAADLAADVGTPVHAMADGVVLSAAEKGFDGASVVIDHGDGLVASYACLRMTAGLRPGDPVDLGQTIGFAGRGKLDEADMEPHLHLRVTRDGHSVDPLSVWAD